MSVPEFESGSLAIGLIFPYNNPVSSDRLERWLKESGYNMIEPEAQQALNIGPEGMSIEGEEGIAQKQGHNILFQPSANLNGFSNSSFITVKNPNNVDFESVLSGFEDLYSWIEDEVNIAEDVATIELTIQGLVRTGKNYDLSKYFSTETLDLLEEVGGSKAKGLSTKFESKANPSSSDWYQIVIDTSAVGNPNLWGLQHVLRYDSTNQIDSESILSNIDEFVKHAQDTSNE
ncbi:hypothetical protein [Haloferax prahovense]|uniref:hypothetical protein n=1 Tax=Haloferax prahovense TaxID=381852 RepID=UPI0012DD0AA7|nr:hypothetical protein [Haloferax prahovense]